MRASFKTAFAALVAVVIACYTAPYASAQYAGSGGNYNSSCSGCDSGYGYQGTGYQSTGCQTGGAACGSSGAGYGSCGAGCGTACGGGAGCGSSYFGGYQGGGCKGGGCHGGGCHGGGCCKTNDFYFQAEALFLYRTQQSDSQSLVLENQTQNELLNTDDFDFTMNAGVRATLGLSMANCKAIELTYFGLQDWDETRIVRGNDNLRIPGDLAFTSPDFLNADQIQVDYSAHIDNGEVNLVHTNSRLSVLGGFRYLGLNEFMRINSFDVATGDSDYIIQTANDLYGGQLGLRLNKCVGPLNVRLTGKSGLFYNDASQLQWVADQNVGNIRTSRGDDHTSSAWIADLSLDAGICLTHAVSLRGGYNVMWIDRLALAPDQLDFSDAANSGTGISTNGNAFFHGFHAGFEIRK
ncbi:MAG: hypothetical protein ACR2NP_01105 [Pirellulaceae bacterium]